MKPAHSPAPWTERPLGFGKLVSSSDGTPIAVFYGEGTNPRSREDRALAMAGPAMLETLEIAARLWCGLDPDTLEFDPRVPWEDKPQEFRSACRKVRAALLAARGEQP